MKAREIGYICIAVRSVSASRGFYEPTLGLEPASEHEALEESIRVARY